MQIPEGYILIKETEYLGLLERLECQNKQIEELTRMNLLLTKRIEELEGRLNQNSNNSSKPPSSDGFKKPVKNNREKSDRKPGAQPGHKGSGLSLFTDVERVVTCKVEGKCSCGKDLSRQPVIKEEKRQVIDLLEKLFEVTEYNVEVKKCTCGQVHKAEVGYNQRVQYGERLKALLVYLNVHQQIPFDRLQEFTKDIIGLTISDGLIQGSAQQCSENIEKPIEQIKEALLNSDVAHADETGVRCEKKTSWLHSLSTLFFTLYFFHLKRGNEAMDAMGILPYYQGVLVHDRWASYNKYDCTHSLCNAHLLRELKYMHEEMNRKWAEEIKILLQRANDRKIAGNITAHFQTRIRNQIGNIVYKALRREPKEKHHPGKRGRKAKSKAILLLEVFRDRIDQVLLFLYMETVPFDNNQAERDIRMIKLKQKISGCFRSKNGIETYCKIRSYISTVKKQNKNVWQAIAAAIQGNPADLLVSH
jgi:transposase